jgi:hypothetical protein
MVHQMGNGALTHLLVDKKRGRKLVGVSGINWCWVAVIDKVNTSKLLCVVYVARVPLSTVSNCNSGYCTVGTYSSSVSRLVVCALVSTPSIP